MRPQVTVVATLYQCRPLEVGLGRKWLFGHDDAEDRRRLQRP
jgi:hypothetical protein